MFAWLVAWNNFPLHLQHLSNLLKISCTFKGNFWMNFLFSFRGLTKQDSSAIDPLVSGVH